MEYVELVVKIPKEIQLALINNIQLSIDQQSICDSYIKQAIINSAPLPKGHGDLIDKNLITNEIEQAYRNSLSEPFAKLFVEFMTYIDDAHPIIEADVESEG